MAENENDDSNSVLYELHVHAEWVLDSDANAVKPSSSQASTSYWPTFGRKSFLNPWNLLQKQHQISEEVAELVQSKSNWQICVSLDGKVAAILQETILEIRTSKDEYCTVIGKTSIHHDPKPQWRKMCWSPDNSMLAFAYSGGTVTVCDLLASNIATISPNAEPNNTSGSMVNALIFYQPKVKNTKWSSELLIANYDGTFRSYFMSAFDGCQENIKCDLSQYYPDGITAVTYHPDHHILIISGYHQEHETSGMSAWRILTDPPYLKLAVDTPKLTKSLSFLRLLPTFTQSKKPSIILKMKISLNGQLLACVHSCGSISLWHLPGLRLFRHWSLHEQPEHHVCHLQAGENIKSEHYFYPVDVDWWSDQVLIIARRSGATSVCSVSSLRNLLGDSPEFLSGSPQISSVRSDRPGFLALECEVARTRVRPDESDRESEVESETSLLQANIQAALYSFTDMERFEPKRKPTKLIQKTYRLLGLKSTTPEELYSRKIDNEEYEDALSLAQQYNLDTDLVYQRQWRISNVSTDTIDNYLSKVKKISWVVKECVDRLPDQLVAARALLEFGLNITKMKGEHTKIEELDSEQLQLVSYRRKLFLYLDNLTIYEKIIDFPKNYNQDNYNQFRNSSPLASTVNFARSENWQAVSIMFTYRGGELLQHWLPVMSNFPETMLPLHYRSLLPELIGDEVVPWEKKKLRFPDWSELEPFVTLESSNSATDEFDLYQEEPELKQFITNDLTCDIVCEWYRWRCYQIEERSSLVDNSLSFIKLARERNVKDLSKLLCDLLTLDTLVYCVRVDDITLTKLQAMSVLDQAKLLLSRTVHNTLIEDMKNYLLPFTLRVEKQYNHARADILHSLLLDWSRRDLGLPLKLFQHLRDDPTSLLKIPTCDKMKLALDCLYCCESIDQVENCYSMLECLPDRDNGCSSREEELLHDKIDLLERHLSVCEVLHKNHVMCSLKYINDNQNDVKVGRELIERVADYVKRNTMDFSYLKEDLLEIQSNCFTCLDVKHCYEIYATSLLTCDCEEIIQSADLVLSCHENDLGKQISYETSVKLVLDAGRLHFDKAADVDDPCLKFSQACLKIIRQPVSEIHEELDLIESLQLLGDYNVKMLPVQVRICPDRIKLIETCLKSNSKSYRSCKRLMQLAQSLRICGDDRIGREGKVLSMVAEHALSVGDYQYCSEVCSRLINRNYQPCWNIAQSLAQCDKFHNLTQKQSVLAFAILHSPVEHLEDLIELRLQLQKKHESAVMKTRNTRRTEVS